MTSINGINDKWKLIQSELFSSADIKKNVPEEKNDSIEISNTSKVFSKLDSFLNLGKPDRLDIGDLNPKEKEEFLKMLAVLMQEGVVGYEIREVDGKPEKHYIVNQIGDERLYGTKLYKKRGYFDRNDNRF